MFNLVDISEPAVESVEKRRSLDQIDIQSLKLEESNENPFSKDRFVDHVVESSSGSESRVIADRSALKTLDLKPVPQTTSQLILSPTAVIKPRLQESQPPTYRSIIDEFDPIASNSAPNTVAASKSDDLIQIDSAPAAAKLEYKSVFIYYFFHFCFFDI